MQSSQPAGTRRRARRLGFTAAAVLPVLAPLAVPAASAATGGQIPEVTVVAQFAPGSAGTRGLAAAALRRSPRAEPAGRYVAVVPASEAAADLARLRAEPGVRYAEVAHRVHAMAYTGTPNDPCYAAGCAVGSGIANQAYLGTIGAPQAWPVSTGAGVTVAVLDTGVDPTHPDLVGTGSTGPYPDKIVRQTNLCGSDPLCGDSNPNDDSGHGTHVTGILAAITDNAQGVASLGWDVKVDEYKVLNANGDGETNDVASAIYQAVARGDRVINMSLANYSCAESNELGFNPPDCGPDPDEEAAVEYAIAHNVVVVAASGNFQYGGDQGLTYPASYPGVLSVAATDNNGVVQDFSQWGQAANISAPGVGIVSTWPGGGYATDTGTSMSAPQVAAAAALVIAHHPSLTGLQVTEILEASARATSGGHPINGGLLDAPAALSASGQAPTSYLGYEMAGADGSVYSFGSVGAFGDVAGAHLAQPVVGEAMQPNGLGYWLVAADGGVFGFGSAGFHGSTGGIRLNKPIVGMASTPSGQGYWLVASDGGIFAFGDARFWGSTGGVRLNKPIVGMAATPSGRGYWLVASDGGIFAFGDARFWGSTGGVTLNKPVVAMSRTRDGRGYWLVASDGGIFAFGNARFLGSTGGITLAQPVVGMTSTPDSNGYWLVASDGGVFTFGNARFYGSKGGSRIPGPVVAVAS